MAKLSRKQRYVYAFCGFILVCGSLGMLKMFTLAKNVIRSPEYSYALPPVLTYACVASGFFCLLVVAVMRGMFRDVERPKYRMLELEEKYDREEAHQLAQGPAEDENDESWWKGDVHP